MANHRKSGQRYASKNPQDSRGLLNYPRAGVRGWTRWLPSLRLLGVGVLTLFLLGIGLFTVGYLTTGIPSANATATGQTTTVYYDDGKSVIGTFKEEDRKALEINEISPAMQHAAIAAEDRTFYENRGISVKGLSRAVVGVATDNYSGGGSTITQQFVKNYYLTNEQTLTRKVKEMFIAIKIDQEKSKDEILADYLNTIFLGRRSYGVEVAAQNYFGKPASELDVAESALLAAMIQRPNLSDPGEDPKPYEDRFHYVLNGMADLGYISAEEAQNTELPEVKKASSDNQRKGQEGYMLDAVRYELLANGFTDEQIDRGGLQITTTFNKKMMKSAVDAVDRLPELKDGMQVGLTSVDPATGEVKAFYGGKDYFKRMQNASTQDVAQAGSTFKAFALIAGLESGYRLNDSFAGSPRTFRFDGSTWTPKNFGGASYGSVSLLKATQSSINTAYAQLNINIGPDKTMDAAVRAGLPENTVGLEANPANVLGTASPTTLQMASAFATFADQGQHHDPHMVREVIDADGNSAYKGNTDGEQRFEKDIANETTYALQQVVRGGSGSYASNLGRPAAGKTGTSSDNYSAWFVGYTPQLSTAVSIFRADEAGNPIKIGSYGGRGEITGGSFPTQAWTNYMSDALEGEEVLNFPKRPDLPAGQKPENKSGVPRSAPTKAPSQNNQPKESDSKQSEAPTQTKEPDSPATKEPAPKPKETQVPAPKAPATQKPAPKPSPKSNNNGNGSGTKDSSGGLTGTG